MLVITIIYLTTMHTNVNWSDAEEFVNFIFDEFHFALSKVAVTSKLDFI